MLKLDEYNMAAEDYGLRDRLRKSLYYGCKFPEDCSSLPLTELTVEFLQEAAPRELGRVDEYFASSVTRDTCMSPCSMMLGLLYIERLKHKNPEYLKRISSSELFLISMMMATKYLEDEGVDEEVFNDEWAESGGLDTDDVNDLEMEFLSAIDWNLFVKRRDFFNHMATIERRIALTEGLKRGWFTYTDLCVLLNNKMVTDFLQQSGRNLNEVVVASSMAYLASFLTILGSTLIVSTAGSGLVTLSMMMPLHQMTLMSNNQMLLPLHDMNVSTAAIPYQSETVEINGNPGRSNGSHTGIPTQTDGSSLSMGDVPTADEETIPEPSQHQTLRTVLSRFWTMLMVRDTLVNVLPENHGHNLSCKTCQKCQCSRMKKRNAESKFQQNELGYTPSNSFQGKKKQESQVSGSERPNGSQANNGSVLGTGQYSGNLDGTGGGENSEGGGIQLHRYGDGEVKTCRLQAIESLLGTAKVILPFNDLIRGFATGSNQILVT